MTILKKWCLKKVFGPAGRWSSGQIIDSQNNFLKLLTGNNASLLKAYLQQNMYSSDSCEHINFGLLQLQHMDFSRAHRVWLNKTFFQSLTSTHGGEREARIWMKNRIWPETCKRVFNDFSYTETFQQKLADAIEDCLQITVSWLKSALQKVKNLCGIKCQQSQGGLNWKSMFIKLAHMTHAYCDSTQDFALLVVLIYLLKDTLISHFTHFTSQLTLTLLLSLTVPWAISALETLHRRPTLVLGCAAWHRYRHQPPPPWKMLGLQIFTFLFYPFVPALLIDVKETSKERLQNLLRQGKDQFLTSQNQEIEAGLMEEVQQIKQFLEEVRKGQLTFKRNEFGVEMFLQLSIQIIVLFLSSSESATQSGLESVFSEDGNQTELFLYISILWAFKTCGWSYLKIKSEVKVSFLSTTAKSLLTVRGLLVVVTRVFCIVAFFTPFFGLFSILAHWKSEQISLDLMFRNDAKMNQTFPPLNIQNAIFSYWDEETDIFESINFSALYRSDYSEAGNPIPPKYSVYTLVCLQEAYFIFWCLIFLQSICMVLVKRKLNKKFKSAHWTDKILHILETLNLPDSYSDWDQVKGNPRRHKKSWAETFTESVVMILLHFVTNLALLLPVIITGEMEKSAL